MQKEFEVIPQLRKGLRHYDRDELSSFFIGLFSMVVSEQSLIEDVDGLLGRDQYLDAIKLRLIMTLYKQEILLAKRPPVSRTHWLALAMEMGVDDTIRFADSNLVDYLFGDNHVLDDVEVEAKRVGDFMRNMLDDFPGEVRETLTTSGQGFMLRTLRKWSVIADKFDQDLSGIRSHIPM